MIRDLFEEDVQDVRLAPGAMLLRGFAQRFEAPGVTALRRIVEVAPFRHMVTPGGHRMSVAMTNCGAAGWVTDRTGYRYDSHDPQTGRRWPAMPDVFSDLAAQAVEHAVQNMARDRTTIRAFLINGSPLIFRVTYFWESRRPGCGQGKDGAQLEADRVYVMPPNSFLNVKDGILEVRKPESRQRDF